MKFKITKKYWSEKDCIYKKGSVDFVPGLTVLIGCNGAGKSTLLRQIKYKCENNKIPCFLFDNYKDGGTSAMGRKGLFGDMDGLILDMTSSEGERINNNMVENATKIGSFIRNNSNAKELFILLDAIDSGLSVDYIVELKKLLFDTILDDCQARGIEIYIIVSANEYELARGEKCFDVQNCAYVDVPDYETYRKLIIKSRKYKNKRYEHNEYEFE